MTSLYVDRKGVELDAEGDALLFFEGGARAGTVPLAPLQRIFLRGDVHLSASLLGKLGARGIGVVVMSGRKGEATLLMHRPHNDAQRRLAQFGAAQDAVRRLAFARSIVARHLDSSAALLREWSERSATSRYPLTVAGRRVEEVSRRVSGAATLGSLRGLEGAAAAAYFEGLRELFAPGLGFTTRNRRPPRDPVNATLSLGYTLLHAEAVLAACGAGLDPHVGFLHELDFGRESLACDLVEPLRTRVEAFAIRAFRDDTLRTEDFRREADGGCLLGKAGRERFYRAWEPCAEELRGALERESALLVRQLIQGACVDAC